MIKLKIFGTLSVLVMLMLTGVAHAQLSLATYNGTYTGTSTGTMCTLHGKNTTDAGLVVKSLTTNLKLLTTTITNQVQSMSDRTSKAIMSLSAIDVNNTERLKAEWIKAQEAVLKLEQKTLVEEKSLEARQAVEPSDIEQRISNGLAYYRPDLPIGFRQSEMQRYINELNNVPLNNKFRDATSGQPLIGYVDTSLGRITAMGQEFRNFVRLFCDVRSLNGKLASTRFTAYNGPLTPTEYWCGQDRGIGAPLVVKGPDNRYVPLEGASLENRVASAWQQELNAAKSGRGRIQLINAPKNVGELYFEPRSLSVNDQAIYEKAEQQFARFVIGRASDTNNTASLETGEGQRSFMDQQARVAKLALARYPFAEMFSQKVPTMPEGSAQWAAKLIEANIGDCSKPDETYESLCNLTKQLRAKSQISESEFYDVLFSRQFQGMAFTKSLIGMTPGQVKRLQANLMGLQLALNYQRNRMKEQQLALMAALYAQQNQ